MLKLPFHTWYSFHSIYSYIRKLWLLGGLGPPILFFSSMSLLSITIESLPARFQQTPITHQIGRTTLVIICLYWYLLFYLLNIITYQSWILWPRSNHSHVFHPQLSLSVWLEYSVLSPLMTSYMTQVLFKFSLPLSTSSQSYPSVILFMCLDKSASKVFFVMMSAGLSSIKIHWI